MQQRELTIVGVGQRLTVWSYEGSDALPDDGFYQDMMRYETAKTGDIIVIPKLRMIRFIVVEDGKIHLVVPQ